MDDLIKELANGGPLAGWILSGVLTFVVGLLYLDGRNTNKERLADLKESRAFTDDMKEIVLPLVTSMVGVEKILGEMKTQIEILKDRTKL